MLRKHSPLAAALRRLGAHFADEAGWVTCARIADADGERAGAAAGSGLVDYSHLGKLSIRGSGARDRVSAALGGAQAPDVHRSARVGEVAALGLAADEFLIVTPPGREDRVYSILAAGSDAVVSMSGALACIALAGPRVADVLQRSCAMDLGRRAVPAGHCLQTSMHFVNVTFWRTDSRDLIFCTRDYAQSLFEALMDVGVGVGMIVCGLDALPVPLWGEP